MTDAVFRARQDDRDPADHPRNQKDWVVAKPLPALLQIARQAGFTQHSFDTCLSNQKLLDGIDWVREHAASKLGVDSTPTFFINGVMHRGDMAVEELESLINTDLKS